MACLGSVLYDPETAASVATTALSAMTALDTTNARITFTAPANGAVLVRVRATAVGSTNHAIVLLGVLDGATVRGRQPPLSFQGGQLQQISRESVFLVTGLTPDAEYTWDAALAVQAVLAGTSLNWGGPNNTTASDAFGALIFEVWETANLLAGVMYDPATVASKAASALLAMTAMDTTNLRLAFTVPSSGRVLVRLRGATHGAVTGNQSKLLFGVLEGSTVVARAAPYLQRSGASAATDLGIAQAEFVVSGLTPDADLTWDAAYGVEATVSSSAIKYGGPDDANGADAYGGFAYEIWAA